MVVRAASSAADQLFILDVKGEIEVRLAGVASDGKTQVIFAIPVLDPSSNALRPIDEMKGFPLPVSQKPIEKKEDDHAEDGIEKTG